jgi:MOSC domain-containing protein YiiM
VVARPGPDRRRRLARAALTVDGGLEGDRWRPADDGRNANQLTVIRLDQIAALANGQDPAFAGDNLFVDLDLSAANLPPGSQLRVGSATVEVSPEPHDGCAKFAARFGAAALRAVQDPAVRAENRRGVHWRVIADGEVAPGDPITVLRRAAPAGA